MISDTKAKYFSTFDHNKYTSKIIKNENGKKGLFGKSSNSNLVK